MRTGRLALWGFSFGVALVMNPYLACSASGDDEFDYDEAEMRAFVLGEWQGTATLDGVEHPFTLVLEQGTADGAGLEPTSAGLRPQCSSRSFVKPAGACMSETTMPLRGAVTSAEPALNGAVSGDASAGSSLTVVYFDLVIGDGASLSGGLGFNGVDSGSVHHPDGTAAGTFTLVRP